MVAIVASCLALLRSLIVILWQAYRRKTYAVSLAVNLVAGRTLAAEQDMTRERVT